MAKCCGENKCFRNGPTNDHSHSANEFDDREKCCIWIYIYMGLPSTNLCARCSCTFDCGSVRIQFVVRSRRFLRNERIYGGFFASVVSRYANVLVIVFIDNDKYTCTVATTMCTFCTLSVGCVFPLPVWGLCAYDVEHVAVASRKLLLAPFSKWTDKLPKTRGRKNEKIKIIYGRVRFIGCCKNQLVRLKVYYVDGSVLGRNVLQHLQVVLRTTIGNMSISTFVWQ